MPEDKEAAFTLLTELDPNCHLSHFALGRVYFEDKHYEKAIPALERAIDLDAKYLLGYLLLGQCHEKLGRKNDASKVYRQGKERAHAQNDQDAIIQFSALLETQA